MLRDHMQKFENTMAYLEAQDAKLWDDRAVHYEQQAIRSMNAYRANPSRRDLRFIAKSDMERADWVRRVATAKARVLLPPDAR